MTEQTAHELTSASVAYSAEHIRQFKASGDWADLTLTDLLAQQVAERPDAVAVVDRLGTTTWSELDVSVRRLASGLLDLGLGVGSRVAVQLPNWTEFQVAYLAAQSIGAWVIPMATIYGTRDIGHMLRKSRADTWILPATFGSRDFRGDIDQVKADVPNLRHVIVIGDTDGRALAFENLAAFPAASVESLAAYRPDPDEVSRLTFTSGTTALPKAVAHTHNTDLVVPRWLTQSFGFTPDTPLWAPSPITHTAGLVLHFYVSMLAGSKLVLQETWDVELAAELIKREKAYYTTCATPFLVGLLDRGGSTASDLESLTYFLCGGAPVPSSVVERARDELDVAVLRCFGQSEAPLHLVDFPDDPWEKKLTRDGRPFDGVEISVDRVPVVAGSLTEPVRGSYATRGPHVFLGYYDEPKLTAKDRDADGWYTSGDMVEADELGFVLYLDRIKDVINRGGLKISSLEVEEMVASHEAIAGVAIVPVEDPRLGQRVGAYLVASAGSPELSKAELVGHLDELGVSKTKWPEVIQYVDALPMTASGKVQKSALQALQVVSAS